RNVGMLTDMAALRRGDQKPSRTSTADTGTPCSFACGDFAVSRMARSFQGGAWAAARLARRRTIEPDFIDIRMSPRKPAWATRRVVWSSDLPKVTLFKSVFGLFRLTLSGR